MLNLDCKLEALGKLGLQALSIAYFHNLNIRQLIAILLLQYSFPLFDMFYRVPVLDVYVLSSCSNLVHSGYGFALDESFGQSMILLSYCCSTALPCSLLSIFN